MLRRSSICSSTTPTSTSSSSTAAAAAAVTGSIFPAITSNLEIHGELARIQDTQRQKEPFDILYFTPALTVIANADGRSLSITPELLYAGVTNFELRLRAFFLSGGSGMEFGEKQNSRRIELQARLYF